MSRQQRKQHDAVHHPRHYTRGKIEVWDFVVDQGLDFLEGNVVKYICRHGSKNGLEDLRKARAYLERLIRHHEEQQHGKQRKPAAAAAAKSALRSVRSQRARRSKAA